MYRWRANENTPTGPPAMHRLVLPLFVAVLGVATVHGFLVSPVLRSLEANRRSGRAMKAGEEVGAAWTAVWVA